MGFDTQCKNMSVIQVSCYFDDFSALKQHNISKPPNVVNFEPKVESKLIFDS